MFRNGDQLVGIWMIITTWKSLNLLKVIMAKPKACLWTLSDNGSATCLPLPHPRLLRPLPLRLLSHTSLGAGGQTLQIHKCGKNRINKFLMFFIFPLPGSWLPATTTSNMAAKSEKIKQRQTNNSFWKLWQVGRLVFVVIDALRADFVVETQDPRRPKIRWLARQFWKIYCNPSNNHWRGNDWEKQVARRGVGERWWPRVGGQG